MTGTGDNVWPTGSLPDRAGTHQPSKITTSSIGRNDLRRPVRRRSTFDIGTGLFVDSGGVRDYERNDKGEITVNLVNVSISKAAKAIFGDILKKNYVIDQKVRGTVTVQTINPVSTERILEIFEAVLSFNGAAILADDDLYKIVPMSSAGAKSASSLRFSVGGANLDQPGMATQIVPLRFVGASEIARVIEPNVPQSVKIHIDEKRNLLILTGRRQDIANILETVEVFDVDWMRGMSFALIPVQASDPDAVARELDTIFSTKKGGALKGVIRFVANKRLQSILIITSRPQYIPKAEAWLKRLDAVAAGSERRLFTYSIQNRTATELAKIITDVFSSKGATSTDTTSSVAPKFESIVINTGPRNGKSSAGNNESVFLPSAASEADPDFKIVADESNNALLIYATPRQYRRILPVIKTIDIPPTQVLLEATIAEVTLNDQLKFGLRYFLEKGNHSGTFTDAVSGAVGSVFPGFSYLFSSRNFKLALDALNAITTVKVISTPSLMVLDNKKAVLQVGDQVPIATRSSVSTDDANAPVVNTISFRDTGIILTVTPRVNDNGRVILEIEQEVSSVIKTTTSGIDSPTIRQRKINTTVVVNDGDSLALGGLMQDRSDEVKKQIPVLGDVPIVGTLFRAKDDTAERTELIIMITPRVVRDPYEARRVTEEYRRKLIAPYRKRKNGGRKIGRTIKRIVR